MPVLTIELTLHIVIQFYFIEIDYESYKEFI